MAFVVLVSLLVCGCAGQTVRPIDVVLESTQEIAREMHRCANLLYPGLDYSQEMEMFWFPEYPIKDNHLGCVFLCAMYQMTLLHEDGPLDEGNLRTFFLYHNADNQTVEKLVKIMRECYHPTTDVTKTCIVGFEFFLCLRSILNTPEWRPHLQTP